MVHAAHYITLTDYIGRWPILFSEEAGDGPSKKDLDFLNEPEESEDSGNKPPSQRPILIILALLAVVGGGYLAMQPNIVATIKSLVTTPPASNPQVELTTSPSVNKPRNTEPSSLLSPLIPRFQEGQLVSLAVTPNTLSSIMLDTEAMGNRPGPSVHSGELLTVFDGTLVDNTWRYLVHTKSGVSGWIDEQQLEEKP